MIIQLIRTKQVGKAVYGTFALPFPEREPLVYPSIENADFIIPAGKYPLKMTWSPRFKKDMPILVDVPGRTGIRIHGGTKPSHSAGCVLVTRRKEYQELVKTLLAEQQTHAPLYIEVCDPK